jgi:hypothetical protein
MNNNHIDIENRRTDLLVSTAKGLAGAIPLIGTMVGEVIDNLIPDQRQDRIIKFCRVLNEKLSNLEEKQSNVEIWQKELEERFKEEAFIDLFEDGLYQAVRALTDERKEYIAAILKNGLSQDKLNYIQQKKLLNLLEQLNDVEIIWLQDHALAHSNEFFEKHQNVLMPANNTIGSHQKEQDKHLIQKSYKAHLVNLGLLKIIFKKPKKGELPEFDGNTGMIKASRHESTPLGRLLLKNMDLDISP